jgi:hypothetical protein
MDALTECSCNLCLPVSSLHRLASCEMGAAGSYFGETDASGRPHGRGILLTSEGSIVDNQIGKWNQGVFVKAGRVWRGYLPENTPGLQGLFAHCDNKFCCALALLFLLFRLVVLPLQTSGVTLF